MSHVESATTARLVGRLRDRIVRGHFQPRSKLPPRTEIAREFGVGAEIVQNAMSRLVNEGFLEVGARKSGTRVASAPPHLSRYRLIFPYGPTHWGQFWHALEAAADACTSPTRDFACFYGLGGYRDIKDFQSVIDEVRTRSLAGLIFASSANELMGTPLLDTPGVPRVAIAVKGELPGIPKVTVDLDHFVSQSVNLLVAKGRRRLAILCASRAPQLAELFRAQLAQHGLESRSFWEQYASMSNHIAANNVTELLFHPGQTERPDGLIIADDNLLATATQGIARMGIAVPRDLDVVAMTNFPNILPAAVPVTRIGFDIPVVLDLLTERLDQLIQSQTPAELTLVPSISESQFVPTPSSLHGA
jgi:DNA-binding LacI/PurR family transcriptional regulator